MTALKLVLTILIVFGSLFTVVLTIGLAARRVTTRNHQAWRAQQIAAEQLADRTPQTRDLLRERMEWL